MREIKMLRGSSRKSKRLMKFFRMLKKEMHMIGSGMQVWARPGGAQGAGDFSGFADAFGDIFGDIFGGGARQSSRRGGALRGADLKYGLEISLEEAASGITTDIRVPSWEGCSDCGSSGCKKGTKPEVCSSCGGQGQVRMQQGFFHTANLSKL